MAVRRLPVLLLIAAWCSAPPAPTNAQVRRPVPQTDIRAASTAGPTFDFETGDLRGWHATGDAFNFQPTFGDNPAARNREPANHQGNYWIGTYERYQGPNRGRPGMVQGDEPQGTLTSSPITIRGGTLSFLVGGGSAFETRVELRLLDQIEGAIAVLRASGTNSETLHRVTWDLSKWVGRQAEIRIVDAASGGWGHINADDFRFEGLPAAAPPPLPTTRLPRLPKPPVVVQPIPTTVPRLLGEPEERARELIERSRLTVGNVMRRPSPGHPGIVVDQRPPPETEVPPGTGVSIVLSAQETARVPDLSRLTVDGARVRLERSRLALGEVTRRESPQTSGTVLDQRPPPDSEVIVGTVVNVTIATPIVVSMPNLIGRSEREARELLARIGLQAGTVYEREARQPERTVIAQAVPPRTGLNIGRAVDFTVATPVRVTVPNVVGHTEPAARGLLQSAGLRVGSATPRESREAPGTVLFQAPPSDQRVAIGTAINVIVAVPVRVRVPDLIGRRDAEAAPFLEAAQLVRGAVEYRESPSEPGAILAQSPAPGTLVAIGTPVTLVMAVPKTVAVPGVVGQPVEEARRILVAARLGVGTETVREVRSSGGVVLEQSLAAQTLAAVGTAIDLVVTTPAMVTVPNVVGMSDANAVEAITGAGLPVGTVGRQLSLRPGGTVLAQGQPANTVVVFTTPITVDVAIPRILWMTPAGLLFFGGMLTVAGRLRTRARRRERPPSTLQPFSVVPSVDCGSQQVRPATTPLISLELRLQPAVDPGVQHVDGNGPLVIREWRSP